MLARAALRTACTMSSADSSRKAFRPTLGLVMTEIAPAASAAKVAAPPRSVSEEQTTKAVGRSAMTRLRKVMPSMCGNSISITMTSGQRTSIFCSANSGSAAVAMTSMAGSAASTWESIWRTRADSSTIITLIRSAMAVPDHGIRPLRKGQPDVPAPQVEVKFAPPAAADVFGHQGNVLRSQQRPPVGDVARPDVDLLAGRPEQHVGATEQLGLVFAGARPGGLHLVQEERESFAGEAPVEGRASRIAALGQHVVAHAADMAAGMPERDRHAGTKQGRDACPPGAEMEFAGIEENLVDTLRGFRHGLR